VQAATRLEYNKNVNEINLLTVKVYFAKMLVSFGIWLLKRSFQVTPQVSYWLKTFSEDLTLCMENIASSIIKKYLLFLPRIKIL
jgi:hypothetical protein